ncbi:hypothetical protein D3C77_651940 [compost metagenome]
MARDEHDGQGGVAGDQLFLEFQAAHAGHAHVGDQHADLAGVVVFQEGFTAGIGANAIAIGFQQPAQRIADRFVVVNYEYRARQVGRVHACNSSD